MAQEAPDILDAAERGRLAAFAELAAAARARIMIGMGVAAQG